MFGRDQGLSRCPPAQHGVISPQYDVISGGCHVMSKAFISSSLPVALPSDTWHNTDGTINFKYSIAHLRKRYFLGSTMTFYVQRGISNIKYVHFWAFACTQVTKFFYFKLLYYLKLKNYFPFVRRKAKKLAVQLAFLSMSFLL